MLDGKVFKTKNMMPGENAPPMHPHCHCTTGPKVDEKALDEWLAAKADGSFSGSLSDWKTLANLSKNDIIIPRSIGAAGRNYNVLLPDGRYAKLAEGTKITKVKAFAGKGTDEPIRVAKKLEKRYGAKASEWQKVRGDGYIRDEGENLHVELHWYEANEYRVLMKVKRYLK